MFQDTNYLRDEQYRDSGNLSARAGLHQRFSSNPTGWHIWAFAQMALQPGECILECGCGPGWLWRRNLEHLPADCHITLTDLSPGMVTEAERTLAASGRLFQFMTVDIQALPFEDASFDAVIANHMLYHVPNRDRAFAEIVRVLKPDGRFYAATNGRNHMRELWEMGAQLFPAIASHITQSGLQFSLENGREELERWFVDVSLRRYEDSLVVTEPEPLIAYITSSIRARATLSDAMLDRVVNHVKHRIAAQGAFHIAKDTGLFTAQGKKDEAATP
ncbi:MAG: class I SAM-dependent methyltransferase [Anaerolineae bacterium]